ncbi:hypothetical protein [Maribacter sp. 1_MG-2023]|uniref:baeRF3 domain-containing protein n=1 Tax=Maribacter sp. 1_MG-2023 TaxID=3062677 RepID=UPI0026E25C48|nr:hypothetical protein [Maribacter sp. 1_MG-2023]MDO6473740.1 hypothetical protein [Maribacter sp. 1_MG-2023]
MIGKSKIPLGDFLVKLKNVYEEDCITITLNTHRIKPEYIKDGFLLKKISKQVQDKLLPRHDQQFVNLIIERANDLISKIDHSKNLESLILFLNQDIAEYVRLPLILTENVCDGYILGDRNLIRNTFLQSAFYILVLSRKQARMIKVKDITILENHLELFNIDNTQNTNNGLKNIMLQEKNKPIDDFFERVDTMVSNITKRTPLPIILATELQNFEHYLKVSKNSLLIKKNVTKNWVHEKNNNIVLKSWEQLAPILNRENNKRIDELTEAMNEKKIVTDLNVIYRYVKNGRGRTLFVQKAYFQPALLFDDEVFPVNTFKNGQHGFFTKDIIGDLIDFNLRNGGDVVFIDGLQIQKFDKLALTTRF